MPAAAASHRLRFPSRFSPGISGLSSWSKRRFFPNGGAFAGRVHARGGGARERMSLSTLTRASAIQ